MKKAVLISRLLLGIIFFVFGLNGFLHFIPMPPPQEDLVNFIQAMIATGYFLPMVKVFEIIGGILLLTNQFVGVGLLILGPIIINIFLIHLFLDMGGMPMGVILMICLAIQLVGHRNLIAPIFAQKIES